MTDYTSRKLLSFLFILLLATTNAYAQTNTSHQHSFQEQTLDSIAASPQWKHLLHLQDDQPILQDPNFILTLDNFSPKNELTATLELFEKNTKDSCKFIARYHHLSQSLRKHWPYKKPICSKYSKFRNQAPADEISLIYASENLTQPSSMMGHTMLAISGINENQKKAEHAVSYFTNLDSYNIASILWDTLYKGKEGYFIVEPLQTAMEYYLKKEQRSVWRYTLDLSNYQKELIHKHIWELKNVKIPYFFHKQNCATLSQRIIGVAKPNLYPKKDAWISPIDVIKTSSSADIIESTKIYPSNEWKIHLLSDFIGSKPILNNQDARRSKKKQATYYLQQELAKTYNNLQYENGSISQKKWLEQQKLSDANEIQLNFQGYKSPIQTPGDSQLQISYEYNDRASWLSMGWMPASHSLEDDNRQYFSENELRLSNIAIMANPETGSVRLKNWHIYSIKQYIPRNKLTGGLSGNFGFGLDQIHDDNLAPYLGAYTSAGLGLTHKISTDLNIYYMFNIGGVLGQKDRLIYVEPEIGAYLYEVFNMKTWASYKHRLFQNNSLQTWSVKQSFLSNKDISAIMGINYIQSNTSELLSANIELRYYY